MFPPESDPARGRRPSGRVHRIGRRGRPLSLVVAVGLFGVFWAASAGMALWGAVHGPAAGRNGSVAGVAFWTVVFALLMWRVWRGGRKAIGFLAMIGIRIGIVFLIGMVAFTVLMFVIPPGGSALTGAAYLLPGLAAGGALLTAGILLRRREVTDWSRR
jgi:hypothetical protein